MSTMTAAISEKTFQEMFAVLRDNFSASTSSTDNTGTFRLSWEIGVRLDNGDVEFQPDGSIRLDELDIIYDPLRITLGVDIPERCIGGFCIIPNPFGGCILRAPEICLFSGDPDISIPLDLGGVLRSEVSGALKLIIDYHINPARGSMTDHDAEDAGLANEWRLLLDPIWGDIDILDIPDMVGDLLDAAIDNALDALFVGLPGWARAILETMLGWVVDLIRAILDLADDIDEWLSNLLGVSIGLFDFVATVLADYFASRNPFKVIEDPFPILSASGPLIPVKVPIPELEVDVNDDEMIITATVGV